MRRVPPPIRFKTEAQQQPQLHRSKEFADYLAARGITPVSADACGLVSIEDSWELGRLMSQPELGNLNIRGGQIPFFDFDGCKLEFTRVRLFGEPFKPAHSKKPAKVLQQYGSQSRLYMPPILKDGRKWAEVAQDVTTPLILTEGELKAIAACQKGFCCAAITGVFNFLHKTDKELDSEFLEDLNQFAWDGREVYVCFDSDALTNPNVRKAEQMFVEALYLARAKPRTVRLPALGGKCGLDDFFKKRGCLAISEFRRLMAKADSPYVPRIISTTEIADMKFEPVQYVVGGLVPKGVSLLVSKPKVGKSFLLLQMGHAIATGTMAFASHCTTKSEVLYIALEDNEQRIQGRMRLMGLRPAEELHIATRWPRGEHAHEALRRTLEENRAVKVVLIDTLQKFRQASPDKKNSTAYELDYTELGMLKAVADEFGCAIVLAHHLKKGKVSDVFEGVLGSTALFGAADTTIVIERGRSESRAKVHVVGRDVEEQELAFDFANDTTCTWTSTGQYAHEKDFTDTQRVFIDVLGAAAEGQPMSLSEVAEAVGDARGKVCTTPNARQVLMVLMARGLVVQDKARGGYVIAPS